MYHDLRQADYGLEPRYHQAILQPPPSPVARWIKIPRIEIPLRAKDLLASLSNERTTGSSRTETGGP